ncbi:SirA-like protein [Mannheimia haemolytica]|uniref:SirA-like protein n=1 Tax=Mannheimia haemolytica TaxID=75985 RepID=A0A378N6C1_MANHA|nr:SirA-like protein [Mannheimia haemolytica]
MQYVLDLTGYACPLPLLMAKKAMNDLKKGDSLEILLNQQSSLTILNCLPKSKVGFVSYKRLKMWGTDLFCIERKKKIWAEK